MKSMKDTIKTEREISNKLANAFLSSKEYLKQNDDIMHSIRCENGKYILKIYKDTKGLLTSYLERMEES